METVLAIRHMTCGHCVRAVQSALAQLAGVREARVEVGRAVVVTDGPLDVEAVRRALEAEGYELG
jgi:copper chaperone